MLVKFKDKFRVRDGTVQIRPATGTRLGVAKIELKGYLDFKTMLEMQAELALRMVGYPAAVMRSDEALMTGRMNQDELAPVRHEELMQLPVAIVTQEHYLPERKTFLAKMAQAGLMRAVFAPSQLGFARQWAESHARAKTLGLLP